MKKASYDLFQRPFFFFFNHSVDKFPKDSNLFPWGRENRSKRVRRYKPICRVSLLARSSRQSQECLLRAPTCLVRVDILREWWLKALCVIHSISFEGLVFWKLSESSKETGGLEAGAERVERMGGVREEGRVLGRVCDTWLTAVLNNKDTKHALSVWRISRSLSKAATGDRRTAEPPELSSARVLRSGQSRSPHRSVGIRPTVPFFLSFLLYNCVEKLVTDPVRWTQKKLKKEKKSHTANFLAKSGGMSTPASVAASTESEGFAKSEEYSCFCGSKFCCCKAGLCNVHVLHSHRRLQVQKQVSATHSEPLIANANCAGKRLGSLA